MCNTHNATFGVMGCFFLERLLCNVYKDAQVSKIFRRDTATLTAKESTETAVKCLIYVINRL